MAHAIAAGASVLIVADTLASQYANNMTAWTDNGTRAQNMALVDPCAVDCKAGHGFVDADVVSSSDVLDGLPGSCPSSCRSTLCAFAGPPRSGKRKSCCVLNTGAADMQFPDAVASGSLIPALHLSLAYGQRLTRECASRAQCVVHVREEDEAPVFDWSQLLIWLIGSGTAALAACYAGQEQFQLDREAAHGGGLPPAEAETATLDGTTACWLPIIASALLLFMFALLQAGFNMVVLINVVFVFAATTSACQVIVLPWFALAFPSLSHRLVKIPFLTESPSESASAGEPVGVPLVELTAMAASFVMALSWFLMRKQPWMWVAQDLFSACICVLFVKTLRLPSLRIAAIFLGLMFCYDIFMVFISPLIFQKSIMLEVATAGKPVESISADGVCHRTESDTFPMLFAVPHLARTPGIFEYAYSPPYPMPPPPPPAAASSSQSSWLVPPPGTFLWRLSGAQQAFGMLGLGDIVLPSLAIAFARRMDLLRRRTGAGGGAGGGAGAGASTAYRVTKPFPLSALRTLHQLVHCWCEGGYYVWASIGYALGLGVTLLANTYGWTFNHVQGQPALLYLVPGVLGALLLRSAFFGETTFLLNGDAPEPESPLSRNVEANVGEDGNSSDFPQHQLLGRRSSSETWCCAASDKYQ